MWVFLILWPWPAEHKATVFSIAVTVPAIAHKIFETNSSFHVK